MFLWAPLRSFCRRINLAILREETNCIELGFGGVLKTALLREQKGTAHQNVRLAHTEPQTLRDSVTDNVIRVNRIG
jgi:hypothetical protein